QPRQRARLLVARRPVDRVVRAPAPRVHHGGAIPAQRRQDARGQREAPRVPGDDLPAVGHRVGPHRQARVTGSPRPHRLTPRPWPGAAPETSSRMTRAVALAELTTPGTPAPG